MEPEWEKLSTTVLQPLQIQGYYTLMFAMPPAEFFAEGIRPRGVFTGYNPDRTRRVYVTWMIEDTFDDPRTQDPLRDDRWEGSEGVYAESIEFALRHHVKYLKRMIDYFGGWPQ